MALDRAREALEAAQVCLKGISPVCYEQILLRNILGCSVALAQIGIIRSQGGCLMVEGIQTLTSYRDRLDAVVTAFSHFIRDLCSEARLEISFVRYEDEDAQSGSHCPQPTRPQSARYLPIMWRRRAWISSSQRASSSWLALRSPNGAGVLLLLLGRSIAAPTRGSDAQTVTSLDTRVKFRRQAAAPITMPQRIFTTFGWSTARQAIGL